jgi:hypothetical protein
MNGTHVDEIAVAAALDRSLADDEAYAVFEHVVGCDACRESWAGVIEADLLLAASAAELRPPYRPRIGIFARRAALALATTAAAVLFLTTIAKDEGSNLRRKENATAPEVKASPILDPAAARSSGFAVKDLTVTKFESDRAGRMTETFRLDASGTRKFTYRFEASSGRDDEVVVRTVEETFGDRP